MPAIPTYDQTVAAPDTISNRMVNPRAQGNPLGAGIAALGSGITNLSNDLDRQDAIRQAAIEKQTTERARSWAAQQAGQSLLTETQTLDDAMRKAPPGADGFATSYLKGFDERAAPIVAAAPDEASKRFIGAHLQAQRDHLGQAALAFQFKAGDEDVVNRYTAAIQSSAKAVEQNPSSFDYALNTLGQTIPDVRAEVKTRLAEAARKELTNAAAAHVIDQNPYAVQELTQKAMGSNPDGTPFQGPTGTSWVDKATSDQVRAWNNLANTRVQQIENAARRDQDAREKLAEKTVKDFSDLMDQGQYASAATKQRLVDSTKGTTFEPFAAELIGMQDKSAGFASLPATERANELGTMRARGADPAQGTSPEMQKQVSRYGAIDAAINSNVEKNPWEAATKYGVMRDVPTAPINSADDVIKLIQSRLPAQGQLESWTGKKESPLQPQEAEQFATMVRRLPLPQAASAMGQIGAAMGDADRASALARQIKDKDGTLAIAMSLANTQTTEGRYASELVLTGEQAMRDGTLKGAGLKFDDLKQQVAAQVRGAYVNREVEDQVVQAASLIAAAKGGDVDNAVRLATGGGVIDFNGSKVPMPTGFSVNGQSSAEDRFRKAIETLPVDQLQSQIHDGKVYAAGVPVPASDFYRGLKDAQLLMRGRTRDGSGYVYGVKAGNGLVTNSAGQPVLITIR